MEYARTIGNNVFFVRKFELNMTQEEFAEFLDISKDTVSNIERGKVVPSTDTLLRISEKTGKPVEFFLFGRTESEHEYELYLCN